VLAGREAAAFHRVLGAGPVAQVANTVNECLGKSPGANGIVAGLAMLAASNDVVTSALRAAYPRPTSWLQLQPAVTALTVAAGALATGVGIAAARITPPLVDALRREIGIAATTVPLRGIDGVDRTADIAAMWGNIIAQAPPEHSVRLRAALLVAVADPALRQPLADLAGANDEATARLAARQVADSRQLAAPMARALLDFHAVSAELDNRVYPQDETYRLANDALIQSARDGLPADDVVELLMNMRHAGALPDNALAARTYADKLVERVTQT
jgi:hypothetical protein